MFAESTTRLATFQETGASEQVSTSIATTPAPAVDAFASNMPPAITAAAPHDGDMDYGMIHKRTLMLEKALGDARFEIEQRKQQNENAMHAQVALNGEIDRLTHENNRLNVCLYSCSHAGKGKGIEY